MCFQLLLAVSSCPGLLWGRIKVVESSFRVWLHLTTSLQSLEIWINKNHSESFGLYFIIHLLRWQAAARIELRPRFGGNRALPRGLAFPQTYKNNLKHLRSSVSIRVSHVVACWLRIDQSPIVGAWSFGHIFDLLLVSFVLYLAGWLECCGNASRSCAASLFSHVNVHPSVSRILASWRDLDQDKPDQKGQEQVLV